MNMIEMVRKADERKELTTDGRLVYILSKIMEASLKGNDSVRVDAFTAWNIQSGDITAKKIAKRLTKEGFNVSIKIKDSNVYGNRVRRYCFEVFWERQKSE